MKVVVFGRGGKVGLILGPALIAAGHDLVTDLSSADVAVDFTGPEVVASNIAECLRAEVPVVVGTTGWIVAPVDEAARAAGVPIIFAANFSLGAVLMMRLAATAAAWFPASHIVEMHDVSKKDAPSGTAIATAAAMGTPEISSVRLPGLVAHQEVIFSVEGESLTIRHDTTSRDAFVPGVLLALAKVRGLQPGVTVGLDSLIL
ncbi:MAG TPA: dihydrodipicolinate reductase C-terminal domain-containing protein [Acidimicrobiales bacterium]|nr:dihydrodipicolinate reductase C-terminal domain-containing protein [Acidimicrobiales bacterium]